MYQFLSCYCIGIYIIGYVRINSKERELYFVICIYYIYSYIVSHIVRMLYSKNDRLLKALDATIFIKVLCIYKVFSCRTLVDGLMSPLKKWIAHWQYNNTYNR